MYRSDQIRPYQSPQTNTGLDQDVPTRPDQTRPKCTDVNKIIQTYADQIRTDQTKVPRPKGHGNLTFVEREYKIGFQYLRYILC